MTAKKNVPSSVSQVDAGALMLLLADHVNAMLAYWDKNLVCRYANSACLEWFGKTREQMINKMRIDELLGSLYDKSKPYIEAVLRGEKQIFEREIPVPEGSGTRHTLVTYFPHVEAGVMLGFFGHVADVTYLKDLQDSVTNTKRELLKSIIETEEKERRYIAYRLTENISQRLAVCKMAIKAEQKKRSEHNLCEEASQQISDIIKEINSLSHEIAPAEIEMFGLKETLDDYLRQITLQHQLPIRFVCRNDDIERIELADKYTVFRIIQSLVKLVLKSSVPKDVEINVDYESADIIIKGTIDAGMQFDKGSNDFMAISSRVEYYSGHIRESTVDSNSLIEILLRPGGKERAPTD